MLLLNDFVMTTEQQTNLKFMVHFRKLPAQALCMLQQVYKEQALSIVNSFSLGQKIQRRK